MKNDQDRIYPDTASTPVEEIQLTVPAADVFPKLDAVRPGIAVFWLEDGAAKTQDFRSKELLPALAFAEELRKRRSSGEAISHVCISTEHEESVGQAGVSDKLPEGYDWSKQDRAGKSRRR